MPEQANLSIASVRVGGSEYSAVSERTCRTCQSPYRRTVETEAISGRSWRAIVGSLPGDAGLSVRNIRDHWANGHVPQAEWAARDLLSQQADDNGSTIEPAVSVLVNHFQFAQAVVGKVSERLATGALEPTVRDGLRAIELLERLGPDPRINDGDYIAGLMVLYETAQEIMDPAQYSTFLERLVADPTLSQLATAWEERCAV